MFLRDEILTSCNSGCPPEIQHAGRSSDRVVNEDIVVLPRYVADIVDYRIAFLLPASVYLNQSRQNEPDLTRIDEYTVSRRSLDAISACAAS